MNVVDQALQAWYGGDGVLPGITNGLWPDSAPPRDAGGPDLPFITYVMTGVTPDNAIRQYVDDVVITFYLRSGKAAPDEVNDIYERFDSRFNRAIIPVASHTTVRLDRVGGGRARDADGGWVFVVNYQWAVQEGA